MFSVCYRVTNDLKRTMSQMKLRTSIETTYIFEEDLENTTSLLINETRDTLHTTSTCKTTDSRFCDTCNHFQRLEQSQSWVGFTLDVVAQNLAVTLSTTLSESLFPVVSPIFFKHKGQLYLSAFSASRHVWFEVVGKVFECTWWRCALEARMSVNGIPYPIISRTSVAVLHFRLLIPRVTALSRVLRGSRPYITSASFGLKDPHPHPRIFRWPPSSRHL